jgi:hypothetical protein
VDSGHEFELDRDPPGISDQAAARRETIAAYQHPLDHYVPIYEASLRTIKNWKAKGRKVGDLPPFDAPAEMAAWWRRMQDAGLFKWKVPEVLEALEISSQGRGVSPEAPEEAGKAVGESRAVQRARLGAASEELGFAAALQRLQHAERFAHQRWQEELDKSEADFDPVAEKRRAEAWERAAGKLADMEVKVEKTLGREFARWEDVEKAVVKREVAIRDGLRSHMTRVCTKANVPRELFDRLVQVGDEELDKIFRVIDSGQPLFELDL